MKWNEKNSFNGKNYVALKTRMQALLESMDLWNIVTFNELPPQRRVARKDDIEHFFRRATEAKAILLNGMVDSIVTSLTNKQYAFEIYRFLEANYEGKICGSLVATRDKFNRLKYEDGQDMRGHLNELSTLTEKLKSMGK